MGTELVRIEELRLRIPGLTEAAARSGRTAVAREHAPVWPARHAAFDSSRRFKGPARDTHRGRNSKEVAMNKKQQFAVAGDRNGDRGAMAFRRGPAGNHVEPRARDKWERQAEEAAHRILRGERNVARMLTPAPAASLTVPLSRGEPLPVILREQLEEGFGADLSAVRIHRDTAAAAATRNEHAFAFASGRDIYFEEGRYDTTGRRRLLLHEVAHVLQQTGRASSGQVLSATVQNSMGGIQCSPAEIPDFAALRKLHSPAKKGAPENPRFAGVADELAKRVAAGDPAGALEEYFKKSLGKIKDWPAEAESLFYDTLKRYRKFELAAQLIERDDFKGGVRIRTAAWTDELVAALERRNHGSAVYVLAAEKHPALASYTKELARLVEVFIFQPVEAQVPEMRRFDVKEGDTPAKTIEDHVVELSERLDDNTKLSSSEWVFQALHTINRLNNLRKAKCVEIDNVGAKTAAKTNELNIFRKRRDAEGVRDWGDNFLASTKDVFKEGDLQPEEKDKAAWEPFLKKLGARIAEIGRTALDVWDRKKAIDESMAAYNRVPAGDAREAEAIKGLAQVKEAGQKSGLPEQLIHVLTELNRRGAHNESPPPEAEYSKRSLALANTLAEFSAEKLEKQQPELFRKKKTEEVVADIWLSIWVREKASHLRWMGQGPNVALIDERIAQRIRVAKFIKSLARPLAWKEVIEAADVILKAKAENVSQLAILPFPDGKYWHREERSPIEKLSEITEIKGWEPLTGGHLALLYQKDYYDTLAQTIAELAPATDKQEQQLVQSGGLIPFVAGRANEEVRKLPHPERWKVQSYEIAVKGDSKETLLDLIKRHHSFSEISEHSKQQGLEWILPLAGAPFVWFIPPIDFVLPILHGIDLLNAQVAADLPGNEPYAKKLKDAEQLGDSRWFQMLKQQASGQAAQRQEDVAKRAASAPGCAPARTGRQAKAILDKFARGNQKRLAARPAADCTIVAFSPHQVCRKSLSPSRR